MDAAASPFGLRCPCGVEVTANDDTALVALARRHLLDTHPDLTGRYEDDDILSIAYRRPHRRQQ